MSNLNEFVDPNSPDPILDPVLEDLVDIKCFKCGKIFKGRPMRMPQYCLNCSRDSSASPEQVVPYDPTPVKHLTVFSNANLDWLVKDINERNIKKEDIVNILYNSDKCSYIAFVYV